jgi:hypothetical protein
VLFHAKRFADSAGITLGETLTTSAPRAGGIFPTKLVNSSLSISKSVCSALSIDPSSELSYQFLIYSQRRLAQQKKQRERERKDLDALGRRHLANVRVVQRNVVYVVGIGPRFAKEEVCLSICLNLDLIVAP